MRWVPNIAGDRDDVVAVGNPFEKFEQPSSSPGVHY
jgi:hypothetical protein